MELNYRHIERDAQLATEIAHGLWGVGNETPYRGGLNIDERLGALRDDLARYTEWHAGEPDGEDRAIYAKKIADTEAAIRETEAEIAELDAEIAAFEWAASESPKPPTEKQAATPAAASSACGLGNRLSKGMSRKAAFTKAWAIVKNGGIELPVTGVSFGSRQAALAKLSTYNPKSIIVLLVPDPDCPHDPEAIAVKVMVNGGRGIYTLGYIPRAETKVVRAFLGSVPEIRLIDGATRGARIRFAA